jgi:hypothetical protein
VSMLLESMPFHRGSVGGRSKYPKPRGRRGAEGQLSLPSRLRSTTNRRNRDRRSLRVKPALPSTRSNCARTAWLSTLRGNTELFPVLKLLYVY